MPTPNKIAGVALEDLTGRPCRVHVASAAFAAPFAVASSTALDGTAAAVAVEIASLPFTVRVPFCPLATLRAVVAAVNAALAAGVSFRVEMPLTLFPVNHLCVSAGAGWFQYDETSRGEIIRNVLFSFVAIGGD